MFQAFNLVPTLTAIENITLPADLAGRKADPSLIERIVGTMGLGDRLKHRPRELSGGQQQRVAVARALANRPEIVFADEPTGNLDSATSAEILEFLRGATTEFEQTIVIVTHDAVAASFADRVLFLDDGADRRRDEEADADQGARPHEEVPRLMFRLSLRNISDHKGRFVMTALAIILGVSFVVSSFVLSDTIRQTFRTLFVEANENVDLVVRTEGGFDTGPGGIERAPLPAQAVDLVKHRSRRRRSRGAGAGDHPRAARPQGQAGAEQRPARRSVSPGAPARSSTRSAWPKDGARGPTKSLLDQVTFEDYGFKIGSDVKVQLVSGAATFKLVGAFKFGESDGFGGAHVLAFDEPTAAPRA